MKYKYTSIADHGGPGKRTKRPMVEIEIFGATRTVRELALIDSGADISLFNLEIAELIGIDLSHAASIDMVGIVGGQSAWLTAVDIGVQHLNQKITIPAAFIDSPHVGVLLGQDGFFDQHRIKFEKDHDTFELMPTLKK